MHQTTVLETVLARDRLIVLSGLVTVIVLSWVYILLGARMGMTAFDMTTMTLPGASAPMPMAAHGTSMASPQGMGHTMRMAHAAMMQPAMWTLGYAVLMFGMWWVMMVAMMLPSASPMILLFARVYRGNKAQGKPVVPASVFASGYLIIWGLFSVLAVGMQWSLERLGLLSTMMASTSGIFAGLVLVIAGLYQLTPWKHACLRHCRSPLQFLMHYWRQGTVGALRMGIDHGLFCLGCCWFLMVLLFVGGVMNLYWIIGLALFVLLEKTIPAGHWLGSLTGIGLMLWGGWMLSGILL